MLPLPFAWSFRAGELSGLKSGSTFSFFGADDMPGVNPALWFGGQLEGLLPITGKEASRRAGIPKNLYSATATYAFDNGIALSGDVTHVDAVYSGQSQAVKLPVYWLLNLGASYTKGPWLFRVVVKNVNNARYFRANFTELFGSTIALPEVPRNFQATAGQRSFHGPVRLRCTCASSHGASSSRL